MPVAEAFPGKRACGSSHRADARCLARVALAYLLWLVSFSVPFSALGDDYLGPLPSPLVSIDVNAPNDELELLVGETFQLEVIASFEDGTQEDVTEEAHFGTGVVIVVGEESPEVLSVTDTGQVHALAVGDETLSVSRPGHGPAPRRAGSRSPGGGAR